RYDGARGLTWSPDNQRVFYSHVSGAVPHIWTMTVGGADRRELVSEGQSTWPAISPDGRTLVFVSSRGDRVGIWRAEADGSQARLLTNVIDAIFLRFAPDGRNVYFVSSMDGAPSTYRVSIEDGSVTLAARFLDRSAVSPDGRLLAGIYRETVASPFSLGVLEAT